MMADPRRACADDPCGSGSTAASLPPVAGRRRNHALAAARRTRAVQLRTEGWTYEAIAQQLGYASRATVYAIVLKALDRHEAEEVDRLRSLEAARLDRLQASLWGRARMTRFPTFQA